MGVLGRLAGLLGRGRTTCALCGDHLGLRFLVDTDGKRFCLRHGSNPLCHECGRLGVRTSSDGLRLCGACTVSGVVQAAHARAILAQVRADLQGLHLRLPPGPIPIRLAPGWEINATAALAGSTRCQGRIYWRNSAESGLEILDLAILRGLPPVSCGRIVAHELGHAWLLSRGLSELPPLKAEGFCELCAWLWLTSRQRPLAETKVKAMERNPDPIYGEGFRAARKAYQAGGLKAVLCWLQQAG